MVDGMAVMPVMPLAPQVAVDLPAVSASAAPLEGVGGLIYVLVTVAAALATGAVSAGFVWAVEQQRMVRNEAAYELSDMCALVDIPQEPTYENARKDWWVCPGATVGD